MIQRLSATIWLAWLVIFSVEPTRAEFKLLSPYSQTLLERIEKFAAADVFKEGRMIGNRELTAIGWNFSEHFLGVVERGVPETALKGWTLLQPAEDVSLIRALGGEQKAGVFLGHIYRLMEMGETGPSHVDWQSNFAYVRSPIDQRLWAIHWSVNYHNEWSIGAVLVPHPDLGWSPNSRLFGGYSAARAYESSVK